MSNARWNGDELLSHRSPTIVSDSDVAREAAPDRDLTKMVSSPKQQADVTSIPLRIPNKFEGDGPRWGDTYQCEKAIRGAVNCVQSNVLRVDGCIVDGVI